MFGLPDPLVALLVLVCLCGSGLYTLAVYNDLSRRWEALRALRADVQRVKNRGQAVRQAVVQRIRTATRHEQRALNQATRRRGRGGRLLAVQDTANGWPQPAAIGTNERGLNAAIEAHDREQQAWHHLHAAAQEYNALLRTFPTGLIARSFGFQPWRLNARRQPHRRGNRKAIGRKW